jgi:hypothetical protein
MALTDQQLVEARCRELLFSARPRLGFHQQRLRSMG